MSSSGDRDNQNLWRTALGDATDLVAAAARVGHQSAYPQFERYMQDVSSDIEAIHSRLCLVDTSMLNPHITGRILSSSHAIAMVMRRLIDNRHLPYEQLMDNLRDAERNSSELRAIAQEVPGAGDAAVDITTSDRNQRRREWRRVDDDRRGANLAIQAMMREVEGALDQLRLQQAELHSRLERASQDFEQRFDLAQDRRNERFEEIESERRTEFSAAIAENRESWEAELKHREAEADQLRGALETLTRDAERVLGASAAAATFGASQKEAEGQAKVADRWRTYAVVSFFSVAAIGIWLLFMFPPPSDPSITEMIVFFSSRGSIFGFGGYVGFYCAQESRRHRSREIEARGDAMNMSAFRPFLEELPITERNAEIRLGARRFFRGRGTESGGDGPNREPGENADDA